jgi:hypothetical protein
MVCYQPYHTNSKVCLFVFLSFFSLSLFPLHQKSWWLDVLQGGIIGAVRAVLMFYTVVFMAITVPFRCKRWLCRATVVVLQRTYELVNPRCHCITNDGVTPPRFIPFVDVFLPTPCVPYPKFFLIGVCSFTWHHTIPNQPRHRHTIFSFRQPLRLYPT